MSKITLNGTFIVNSAKATKSRPGAPAATFVTLVPAPPSGNPQLRVLIQGVRGGAIELGPGQVDDISTIKPGVQYQVTLTPVG
jgi:hypothetical protein